MSYLGSWKIDDYLTFPAITHRFDTGALTDADDVPAYRIYEDETGTAIVTGSMAKLDDANTTGFYTERVQLTTAAGFEKGKCYTIYVTATVNSVTGGQHHTFQLEAEVDANVVSDKTGYALSEGGVTAVQTGLATPTNITAGTITTVTNLTNAPTNGDLTATMKSSVTAACTASTPTAAAVTGAVGSVTNGVTLANGAHGGAATVITLQTPIVANCTQIEGSDATDQINSACNTACSDQLVAVNLDHLCKTATANADMTTEVSDNTILARILANGDTSAFDPATDGLQLIRDKLPTNLEDLNITDTTGLVRPDMANASGNYAGTVATVTTLTNLPSATENWLTGAAVHADAAGKISDAVWDELSTGHTDAGKAGAQMWTDVDAVKAVTDKLDTMIEDIP